MKLSNALMFTLCLAGCASHNKDSNALMGTESSGGGNRTVVSIPITDAKLVFAVDKRPLDGKLVEFSLSRNENGTYAANLRTAFVDMRSGARSDKAEELGTDFQCSTVMRHIECRVDHRTDGGKLSVIAIQRNAAGTNDVRLDDITSDMKQSFRILATNLTQTVGPDRSGQ